MFRASLGASRMDAVRNEYIGRWGCMLHAAVAGGVHRGWRVNILRMRMLRLELAKGKGEGEIYGCSQKRRSGQCGVGEEGAAYGVRWRQMIGRGRP